VSGRPVLAKPKGLRRVERWLVGVAMAVFAVILERVMIRQVKKGRRSEEPAPPTTLTSRGGEVDL
jgi:hypothetical protein